MAGPGKSPPQGVEGVPAGAAGPGAPDVDEWVPAAEFLRKLEYLRVVSRRLHTGRFAALQRSRKLGSGIDFADHRPYTPGDDFKDIDWNLFGRLDRLMIRLAEEETELNLYLLVDRTASMGFGTPSKALYAARVASALAYVALAHLDRVHLFPFGADLLPPLHPPRHKAQVVNVYRHLASTGVGPEGDLAAPLRSFAGVARSRGVAVVVSDFQKPWREGIDLLRFRRFDVALVHVYAPEEDPEVLASTMRRGQEVLIRGAEGGRPLRVRLGDRDLRRYAEVFAAHGEGLSSYARAHNLFYAHARSDHPFEELVLETFRGGRLLG